MLLLWDDDAEGGDSLCLVLMEREAAAAYSHDLAGEGETDSASFRLRGEERDENVGSYIFGDETGVVAHVDDGTPMQALLLSSPPAAHMRKHPGIRVLHGERRPEPHQALTLSQY